MRLALRTFTMVATMVANLRRCGFPCFGNLAASAAEIPSAHNSPTDPVIAVRPRKNGGILESHDDSRCQPAQQKNRWVFRRESSLNLVLGSEGHDKAFMADASERKD